MSVHYIPRDHVQNKKYDTTEQFIVLKKRQHKTEKMRYLLNVKIKKEKAKANGQYRKIYCTINQTE